MDRKVNKLIELHSDLAGDLANFNAMDKEQICISYLIQSLIALSEKTRFEPEILAMIETCKPWVNQLSDFK